ncbi:hypothetical protein ACFQ0B_51555 [Nonomuraea thailandensis]
MSRNSLSRSSSVSAAAEPMSAPPMRWTSGSPPAGAARCSATSRPCWSVSTRSSLVGKCR